MHALVSPPLIHITVQGIRLWIHPAPLAGALCFVWMWCPPAQGSFFARTLPPAKKHRTATGALFTVPEIHLIDQRELRPSSGAPMIYAISRTLSVRRGWKSLNFRQREIRWNFSVVEIQSVGRVRGKTSVGK